MKILLDTNIIIHREASHVKNEEIGTLFRWIDQLHYVKCIHPLTIDEIRLHQDQKVVKSMEIKLDNYHILKTEAPLSPQIKTIIDSTDKDQNSKNDSKLLNELLNERVDVIITEDRAIHEKSELFAISDRVFTISSFLEKVNAENPSLVDYKVLSVRKECFGNINLRDKFFDTFKEDYVGFDKWFNKKSDEIAYICKSGDKLIAFLYLKSEETNEDYSDINPIFSKKKRLKIGTFKVTLNGFKLGERFLKIVFDNALKLKADEIYVTIFPKRIEQMWLIELLKDWGFRHHGAKTSSSDVEQVYVRDFKPEANLIQPKLTFPYISINTNIFLTPIYPEYHTELFPDSILRTESPKNFVENQPHRNAISKVYISRSWERDLKSGDLIVFYRTGGYHKGVATTLGLVERVITNISDASSFVRLCRKRSVFSDNELVKFWNYDHRNRPFIVNFLYVHSFKKRPNLKRLNELGIIPNIKSVPRGFTKIPKDQLLLILKEACVDEGFIID